MAIAIVAGDVKINGVDIGAISAAASIVERGGQVAAAIGHTPPCTASTGWQSHGNHEAMVLATNLLDAIHGYRKPITHYTTTEA